MSGTQLTIVIPAHNEEGCIHKTLTTLEEHVKTPHEIVVVNDHCRDGTVRIVKEFIQDHPNVQLVENLKDGCFANSITRGFEAVEEGAVVVVMADLSDDPKTIDTMYETLQKGHDIVCGSRYMPGGKRVSGPPVQGFFSRFVGTTTRLLTGIPTWDVSNAFKMYTKEVLDYIDIRDKWFAMSMEIAVKAHYKGFRITEVPTTWQGRTAGESSFSIFRVAPSYIKLYIWTVIMRVRSVFVARTLVVERKTP